MKYSLIMTAGAVALSLGLAGGANAAYVGGGNGNSGSGSGNMTSTLSLNLPVTTTVTKTNNISKSSAFSLSKTANINKDNMSVGGNFSAPNAETNQTLSGNVSGNAFNLQPGQAAAAPAFMLANSGSGGNGGSGNSGTTTASGAPGGSSNGSAAAASSGAQPIYTGAIGLSGATMQNLAGISTVSFNTGIGSNALAASGVTANANVTFGSGNHP